MIKSNTDNVFLLVKSLTKSEKQSFRLEEKKKAGNKSLKFIQLFDALDKMKSYDEQIIFKKYASIKKIQLSNLKANLYRKIIQSLRNSPSAINTEIMLHEQLIEAQLLFNKGLYWQSLKLLEKLKSTSQQKHQLTISLQELFFEKKIESLFITRSHKNKAQELSDVSKIMMDELVVANQLSNLSLQLYDWYIKHGHVRNKSERDELKAFFNQQIFSINKKTSSFYSLLFYYQCYCWFAFINQDFLQFYRYAQHWVDLFQSHSDMQELEPEHYIKGLHNLINAHFYLRNAKKHEETLQLLEKFSHKKVVTHHQINKHLLESYLIACKINKYFLEGTFSDGIKIIQEVEKKLQSSSLFIDDHRVLVIYYKIACLYFGAGKFELCVDYLQKIIQSKLNLRSDLQCYARLLHLIAHYEMGNYNLIEYLAISVYNFMCKMKSMSVVEETVFNFLKKAIDNPANGFRSHFKTILHQLKKYENNPYESRAYIYLDLISWLESKLTNKPVEAIIREKFLKITNYKLRMSS